MEIAGLGWGGASMALAVAGAGGEEGGRRRGHGAPARPTAPWEGGERWATAACWEEEDEQ